MLQFKKRREETDWQYSRCSVDSRPEAFGPFQELVALWQSKRRGRLVPERADFDFTDFKPWLGRIAIADFETDPFNVRFVLWGTDLVTWWGADYTNKSLGELAKRPELLKEVEGQYFLDMKNEPFIGLVEGRLERDYDSYRKVMGVDLPMGRNGTPEKVMLVHEEIATGETLEELLPDSPAHYRY